MNAYLALRGNQTKCALEHVRKASAMERRAGGSWAAALEDCLKEVAVVAPVQPEANAQANAPTMADVVAAPPALPAPLTPRPLPLVAELPLAVEPVETVEPVVLMPVTDALPSEASEPEAGVSLGALRGTLQIYWGQHV